jgi:hypothetical protein
LRSFAAVMPFAQFGFALSWTRLFPVETPPIARDGARSLCAGTSHDSRLYVHMVRNSVAPQAVCYRRLGFSRAQVESIHGDQRSKRFYSPVL